MAGVEISRSEIWGRWFAEESGTGYDHRGQVQGGPEGLAAWADRLRVPGRQPRVLKDVRGEMEALDSLMAEGGVIVVDDYHLGVVVYRVRSRLLNGIPGVNRTCAGEDLAEVRGAGRGV